jgi:hypothetical protein
MQAIAKPSRNWPRPPEVPPTSLTEWISIGGRIALRAALGNGGRTLPLLSLAKLRGHEASLLVLHSHISGLDDVERVVGDPEVGPPQMLLSVSNNSTAEIPKWNSLRLSSAIRLTSL